MRWVYNKITGERESDGGVMSRFRCPRDVAQAEGDQTFEVEAEDIEEAIQMFEKGEGVLVETDIEVMHLDDYDLSSVYLEE